MNKISKFVVAISLIFTTADAFAKEVNYLKLCWNKQVKPLQGKYLVFSYQESLNELEHSFEPWQQTKYIIKGTARINADNFLKSDTLTDPGNKQFFSKAQFNNSSLLFMDYGNKELSSVTQTTFLDQPFKTARYMPILLINYFHMKSLPAGKESDHEFAVYKLIINKSAVKLFIRKADCLLNKVTVLSDDELFGDVLSSFIYKNYSTIDQLRYPTEFDIEKINGKIKDEVKIIDVAIVKTVTPLLVAPVNYLMKEIGESSPDIKIEKYNDNIYFVELKHTDDKIMIVEFADFVVVAEAPLNSSNGELIIKEARKIAPGKPIKYFVFGHYHPHYLGGIRPFIHKEATILCTKANKEYVDYLLKSPHTLNPDSLQIQPRPLKTEEIKESKIITDGKLEMKIYLIGPESEHTNDYLIYYFPASRLLFQDDLVWIAKQGEIKKAGKRQTGLYNAIKKRGLEVTDIIQSWPVADYGVKTVIPFKDLEKSMTAK